MSQNINAYRLFGASCVALIVTALTFATRGGMMEPRMQEFGLTA